MQANNNLIQGYLINTATNDIQDFFEIKNEDFVDNMIKFGILGIIVAGILIFFIIIFVGLKYKMKKDFKERKHIIGSDSIDFDEKKLPESKGSYFKFK